MSIFRTGVLISRRVYLQFRNKHRCVSTLSPLASAFNTKPSREHFKFRKTSFGLFNIPQLTDETGFYLLQEKVQDEIDMLVSEAISPTRSRKIIHIFDELSDCICRVADMADFLRVSHPSKVYRSAAEETCVKLSGLVEKLNTNIDIHAALKKVLQDGDVIPTDARDRRVAELFMFDFEQSGIHLPDDKRKKFVMLNENIILLGNYFMEGTHAAVAVDKSNLPEHVHHCFNIQGDNITVTGLFPEHYDEFVREAAYRIFLYPHPHQEDLLRSFLMARHKLAQLVDFPTFAQRALRGTMAGSAENVMNFLTTLADNIRESAQKDYNIMLKMKLSESVNNKAIMPWDPPYYSAVRRHEECNVKSNEVAPYFSLGCCMDGLSNLFHQLYDITLQPVRLEKGETWSYDVYKLAVVHGTEGILGYIYCDFYERAGKPNQDCHFTIQGGREKSDSSYQLPIVVLQLNFPPPQTSVPSLLTPGMVENLFHEFGHAMHSMLGRTKYQHVTGTRCPTDFAEVPSVLMEYFASDPRVLSTFARHYQTGEPLPEKAIRNICQSKKIFAASEMQVQVFQAILDQVYHSQPQEGKSTTDILADVQNKYHGIPYVAGTAWQLRFSHLVGYGAKYYSYLMARAVASRIWHQCFKQDPFNRAMGEKYRREMLCHGGEIHPSALVEGLLNEEPTVEKFVQSLLEDVLSS
ncbi:hypothetical protein ACJMK2_018439 [Sinanodonta woodiana]|uniref:Peptidase M3A/M3B catalytic domain-containing protein n=1 Tax=Sinanodonta woodiana TaxID=1069815 RepID=A0ABD3UDF0_SINWO